MSSFVDTTLLECNRLQSIEGLSNNNSNNNAEWTNRMGEVVQLNPGDRVSVSSAYVNTRGCGGNNIEIKGKDFNGITKKFRYTKLTFEKLSEPITSEFSFNENPQPFDLNRVGMIQSQIIENVEEDILLRDDEMNIEMGFYKNTNGENYMHLPRRFYGQEESTTEFEKLRADQTTASDIWKTYDTFNNGNGALQGPHDWHTSEDNVSIQVAPADPQDVIYLYPQTNIDCQELKVSDEWFIFNEQRQKAIEPGKFQQQNPDPVGDPPTILVPYKQFKPIYSYYRQKNDNKRYTLMKQPVYYSEYIGPGKAHWDDIMDKTMKYSSRKYNPCLLTFINYKELIKIKVDKGFNSPESVAEQITQQFQKNLPDNPKTFSVYDAGASYSSASLTDDNPYADVRASIRDITETYSTNTWKPVMCGNMGDNSETAYKSAYGKTTASQDLIDHYNSFRNIYARRPDFIEKGRLLNNGWGVLPGNASTDPRENGMLNHEELIEDLTTNTIKIANCEYTDANLKLFSAWFIEQGKHPELFRDNDKLFPDPTIRNINNSRFIHMNRWEINASHYTDFGDDNYEDWNYWNGNDAGLPFYDTFWRLQNPIRTDPTNRTHQSVPVFFGYQPENEGVYIEHPNASNLSYGFAQKYEYIDDFGDKKYGIELNTKLVGGMDDYSFIYGIGESPLDNPALTPVKLHGYQKGPLKPLKYRMGYDHSFSAYGNAVIQGFSGYNLMAPNGEWAPGITAKYNQYNNWYSTASQTINEGNTFLGPKLTSTYIGAKNCACSYDTITNKFGFKYLHTAENIANQYDAGSTGIDTSGTTNTNPIISDADEEVYKINKRPKLTTYTPNMKPYSLPTAITLGNVSGTTLRTRWEYPNENIQPWKVYDAHSGVFMDFKNAYTEETFKDGLLGIMGFTYEQFNSPSVDRQARIGYDNISYLGEYITTNSQIVSTDTSNFIVNPYGAVLYTTQIPTAYLVNTMISASELGKPTEYLPVISEQTQSITIEGAELPRTMLRPYYCIRSDIIGQSNYVGGTTSGLRYPIISVINKINSDKDFVQLSGGDMTMTITKQVRLTDITTTITDPNGTLANLDDGSCVIYRIEKDDNTERFDIIDQILNKNNKKK